MVPSGRVRDIFILLLCIGDTVIRHPMFYTHARLGLRRAMREKGYSRVEIRDAIDAAMDEVVDSACSTAGADPTVGTAAALMTDVKAMLSTAGGSVTGIGDGHIIEAIIAFFKTPLGQAIIQILMMLVMMFI